MQVSPSVCLSISAAPFFECVCVRSACTLPVAGKLGCVCALCVLGVCILSVSPPHSHHYPLQLLRSCMQHSIIRSYSSGTPLSTLLQYCTQCSTSCRVRIEVCYAHTTLPHAPPSHVYMYVCVCVCAWCMQLRCIAADMRARRHPRVPHARMWSNADWQMQYESPHTCTHTHTRARGFESMHVGACVHSQWQNGSHNHTHTHTHEHTYHSLPVASACAS